MTNDLDNNYSEQYPWIDYVLEICTGINHFIVDGVKVFIACNDMEYPADSHVHNDFEFMCVKRQTLTNVLCEDRVLTLPQNYIMPFMPMQRHGCATPVVIRQYIAFAFPFGFHEKFKEELPDFDFNFKNIAFPASSRFDYLVGYLFECYSSQKSKAVMQRIIELIFLELCQDYNSYISQQKNPKISGLLKAKTFLDSHIFLPFDLEEAAKVANMSKYYFCRLFKESFDMTPNEYLITKKIERAKIMIATTEKTLTDIALEMRFDSIGHFSKHFKKICGISPSAYKASIVK